MSSKKETSRAEKAEAELKAAQDEINALRKKQNLVEEMSDAALLMSDDDREAAQVLENKLKETEARALAAEEALHNQLLETNDQINSVEEREVFTEIKEDIILKKPQAEKTLLEQLTDATNAKKEAKKLLKISETNVESLAKRENQAKDEVSSLTTFHEEALKKAQNAKEAYDAAKEQLESSSAQSVNSNLQATVARSEAEELEEKAKASEQSLL